MLHDVADGQEGDAVNRSLVCDLPTRVEAHLITQGRTHREDGGDWEAGINTLSDIDLAGRNTT